MLYRRDHSGNGKAKCFQFAYDVLTQYRNFVYQFKGNRISHADYALLFETDKPEQGGLSIAYKVRHEHIYPNSFSKMNVKLMSQVLVNPNLNVF